MLNHIYRDLIVQKRKHDMIDLILFRSILPVMIISLALLSSCAFAIASRRFFTSALGKRNRMSLKHGDMRDSCQIIRRFWIKDDLNINKRAEELVILRATMTQSGDVVVISLSYRSSSWRIQLLIHCAACASDAMRNVWKNHNLHHYEM